jgi:hypothetical protein
MNRTFNEFPKRVFMRKKLTESAITKTINLLIKEGKITKEKQFNKTKDLIGSFFLLYNYFRTVELKVGRGYRCRSYFRSTKYISL